MCMWSTCDLVFPVFSSEKERGHVRIETAEEECKTMASYDTKEVLNKWRNPHYNYLPFVV